MYNEFIHSSVPNTNICIHPPYHPAKQQNHCDIHLHNEFEIMKVIQGKVDFIINGKHYTINDGDIIFVNSRVAHETVHYVGALSYFVQFGPEPQFSNINSHAGKYLSRFINYGNREVVIFKSDSSTNREMTVILEDIISEYKSRNKSYDMYIKASMLRIFGILYRNNIILNSEEFFAKKEVSKLFPVLEYIDNHYSEQISLGDLSDILSINESYFCRLFKKTVNTTFVQYLNFVRVCKAERMLMSSGKSISEISYETGFASVGYFNKIFKKYKFCTPTHYKKVKYE